MTGILLIFVLLVWIFLCLTAIHILGRVLPRRWWTGVVKVLLFLLIFPLPVIDEISARPSFRSICKEKAVLFLDVGQPRGKSVRYAPVVSTEIWLGPLHAQLRRSDAIDSSSGELVYHYNKVLVTGGWLVRSLKISETNSPIFLPSSCEPKEFHDIDIWRNRLGITLLP